MRTLQSPKALKAAVDRLKSRGKKIGFVPTMGYLHAGHLSLIHLAKKQNDTVVASIFVNPAQFGPGEDFNRYPRDLARDQKMLRAAGTDILYLPKTKEFYPFDYQTTVVVGELSKPLCGA